MADSDALKELIPQVLRYDPETGEMYWRHRPASLFIQQGKRSAEWAAANWNSRHAGQRAFTAVGSHGYRNGRLSGRGLLLHRVAFVLMTGGWPRCLVDHVNGDRLDNRWCNLREATVTQNAQNAKGYSKTSPYIGVSWNSRLKGYMARVNHKGESYYCGFSVDDPERLARQRDKKAKELFGDFASLNFPEDA